MGPCRGKPRGMPQVRMIAIVLGLALGTTQSVARADAERTIDYIHDRAGNITRIVTRDQSQSPSVSSLAPNFIHRGRTISVTATGSNLLNADVAADLPGLSVGDVSTTPGRVVFELTANGSAALGETALRFTTSLGETQASLVVADFAPTVTTDPPILAIADDGEPFEVTLLFSDPRPEAETYDVSVTDTDTATVSTNSIGLSAGAASATITLTGVTEGVTNLDVTLAAKRYFFSFPVFVGDDFTDLLENHFEALQEDNLFAPPVGVVLESQAGAINATYSRPVEVVLSGSDAGGPVLSVPVGVNVGGGIDNLVLSAPVGVALLDSEDGGLVLSSPVGVTLGGAIENLVPASPVGVNLGRETEGVVVSSPVGLRLGDAASVFGLPVEALVGPFADVLEPALVAVDSSVDLAVTGANLDRVDAVRVQVPDDVTVNSFAAGTDGRTLNVSLTVSPGATAGERELILERAGQAVETRSGFPLRFTIE